MKKLILLITIALFSCSKEEDKIPLPEMITVTYGVTFDKATDFYFKRQDNGIKVDTLYNKSSHEVTVQVEDKEGHHNVWVLACVIKPSDIGNISMKAYAIINGDTLKSCNIGTCCGAN